MARGAAQIPAKLESRSRDIELELNRTIQQTDEVHKSITKGERRVKELLFQQEENKKNQDRITDLVDKLQQKIKSYKKQIEEAEEIAAINLAKYRKAQQDFEEAEERSKICEANITKYKSARGVSMSPGPVSVSKFKSALLKLISIFLIRCKESVGQRHFNSKWQTGPRPGYGNLIYKLNLD